MNTPIDIVALSHVLDRIAECLSLESATKIASLQAGPELQARIDHLAAKANDGDLSADERREYRSYVEAIDVLGILQVQARVVIARSVPSSQ